MNEVDYTAYKCSDAFIDRPFTVGPVILRPLCLGHLCLFEQVGSPFMSPEEKPVNYIEGMYHLFLALIICSSSFEDGQKNLRSWFRLKFLFLMLSLNWLLLMLRGKEWNLYVLRNRFNEYLKYYANMPGFDEKQESKEDDAPSGTDWKTSMIEVFEKMGKGESEIVNMSLKKLFLKWSVHFEGEGSIRVWNKFDVEQIQSMKKGNV